MPPQDPTDPVADLRERLRATQEAAERLADQPPRVPPQGWATPGDDARPGLGDELAALAALASSLKDLVPPELREQVTELVRQILRLVRALIDHWIERLEGERGAEPEVEDIPIA